MSREIARLIAGGLLALICCYVGLLIKRRYRAREALYKSAIDFCGLLSDELSAKKTPIPDVCNCFLQGRNGAFEDIIANMQNGKSIAEDKLLKREELAEINTFLSTLGTTQLKEQIAHIEGYKKRFEKKHAECEEQSKKLGNMYFKLCALLGVAIILILS